MLGIQTKYIIPKPVRDGFDFQNLGFIKASMRGAILAAAIFAVHKTGHKGLTALGTAVISLPATMAGVGAACLYKGIQMIRANWAEQAFQKIGNGFALAAAGYYILENYKHFSVYAMESNSRDHNNPKQGRGLLEDWVSSWHGHWVFTD